MDKKIKNTIGTRISKQRILKGYSRKDIVEKLGPGFNIIQYEGSGSISIKDLKRIANEFNISIGVLLSDELENTKLPDESGNVECKCCEAYRILVMNLLSRTENVRVQRLSRLDQDSLSRRD
jgi:transcriptional regulator with XRE-family HTH domain